MKKFTKLMAVLLCAALIAVCFAGCSGSGDDKAENPLIVGYYAGDDAYFALDGEGKATGVFGEIVNYAYENYLSGTYDALQFVEMTDDTVLGGDKQPLLAVGKLQKHQDANDRLYGWTQTILENRVIAVAPAGSNAGSFNDLSGRTVMMVGDVAAAAMANNSAVANLPASVTTAQLDAALSALQGGTTDFVLVDEMTFYTSDQSDSFTVLEPVLDTQEFAIQVADDEWDLLQTLNEAVHDMLTNTDNGDTLTPAVEKAFGYDAVSDAIRDYVVLVEN